MLQNPTQYYIKEQQKRQVREYLTSQQKKDGIHQMPISAPSNLQNFNFNTDYSSPSFLKASSNLISPSSPDTTSSVASGSEVSGINFVLWGKCCMCIYGLLF